MMTAGTIRKFWVVIVHTTGMAFGGNVLVGKDNEKMTENQA